MKKVKDRKKVHDNKQPNNNAVEETPNSASVSISVSSNDNNNKNNVSREDIELVQNLIERCIQFYMNKAEVVKTLLSRARVDPRFTKLVWQKLEEENASFFRAYYIRLKMMKQIILFNRLLEHQHHLMNYSVPRGVTLAPHPMPANNIPIGYPVIQQQPQVVPSTGQQPSFHAVTGVPVPANFHPFENNVGIDNTKADDVTPLSPPNNAMPDMPASSTSEASGDHFPFDDLEILPSCTEVDTSPHDTDFVPDMGNSLGLENGAGDSKDSSFQSLGQIPWDFSLSDLTADLSNLEDLGYLGNYPGSPFLLSDSDIDIVLDSEAEDLVEKFFAESDSIPGQCSPADDEEKS